MKKNQLYEIYKELDISVEEISKCLTSILELKGLDSELFYKTCINNKDIICEDNFYEIVKIFLVLCYLNDDDSKVQFYESLNIFLRNDYVTSSEDFENILSTISFILSFPASEVFYIGLEESDNYIIFLLENYFKLFKNVKDYEHDFSIISNKYMALISDLINTETTDEENFIDNCLKRVELFMTLVSDEDIWMLSDAKYSAVISAGESINDKSELSKFRSRIKRISKDISDDEFKEIIENYYSELSSNTIDLICRQLGIEIKTSDTGRDNVLKLSNKNIDEEVILKKILSRQNDDNIIKF